MTTSTMERATDRQSSLRAWLTGSSVAIGLVYLAVVLLWDEGPFALTFDDAWYYFGIARNVAEGRGSTFDGINPTNGYHPLWLLVSVPVYAIGLDGMAAARALLAGQVVCYVAALVILAGTVSRLADGWPKLARSRRADDASGPAWCEATVVAAWVLFAGNPFVVKMFVNGLESGISVVLYALLLVRFAPPTPLRLADTTSRWRCGTGLLLLLIFLARTDAALLAGVLCLWAIFELRREPLRQALLPLAELFAPVLVGGFAYLALNTIAFDTPVQVSGLHKRAPLDGPRLVTFGVLAGLGVYVTVRAWRRVHTPSRSKGRGRFPRVTDLAVRTGWFGGFCFLLLGYYNALQTQQWLWYYAPLGAYALLLLPLAVSDFAESGLAEAPPTQTAARALAPVQAILLLPLVLALVLQVPVFTDPDLRSIQVANMQAGRWMDANLPDDAVAASWDAGVVGYFAGRPVVNLDGVVNSYEYYEASREGRIGPFLAARGITHVVNHGRDVDGEDPDVRMFLRSTFGDRVADDAEVVAAFPFAFSGVAVGAGGVQDGGDDLAVFVWSVPGAAR